MDVSLYKLILSQERPPQTLQVTPATILSMVRAVIDLLVEQQISATLWIKLPPGETWLSEIQRYQYHTDASGGVYILYHIRKPASIDTDLERQKSKAKTLLPTKDDFPPVVPVQLLAKSQLRREYFLLVLSPQFCSLILAHRPRIRRQTNAREKTKKRTPALLSICSFDSKVIQQTLDGIKHAIAQNKRELALTPSQSQSTVADLLTNWDQRFICSPTSESGIISQLLIKQMQQQEQTLRRINTDRIAALQLQNQEMQQALSHKDEFMGNVCQELRTPLTHMKAALSLLNSPQLKPPQKQRYLQILNTECDRQNSLINGLLDLVQLDRYGEHPVLQSIRLSDIVPGVVSTYQPLAQEKGVMLGYTVSPDLPAVSCLNPWLRQIVINLLHNCIKFTPAGGQVSVRAKVQGDYVELEFRDTGIGIPSHEIPKIFDRFYRVRPLPSEDIGGAGLGLTIVQQILERCGGSISVKSRLGEDSTFSVLLPIARSTGKQASRGAEGQRGRKK